MTIKLVSLNIERGLHLDRVLPFLKSVNADVICLQEVLKRDFESLKKAAGMKGFFMPISKLGKKHEKPFGQQVQGNALLTNLPNNGITEFYFHKKNIKEFDDPREIERGAMATSIDYKGKRFHIGTTHFTWTPDGEIDEFQRQDFEKLMMFVKRYKDFVLCGDFNSPRGREMFSKFCEYFKDNLPKDIESTIDEKLHRKKGLKLVVDTIFSTKEYKVSDVKTKDKISDHKAIIGRIDKIQ